RLGALPGVARVERVRLAEAEFEGERISIDALEDTAFAPGREGDFGFAAGDPHTALAAVHAGTGALVSRNFARAFGARVGPTRRLATPEGPLVLPVVGVVVDYVSPRGSVILARPTYVRWWHDGTANRFHVTLVPGTDDAAVRSAIAAGPGAT